MGRGSTVGDWGKSRGRVGGRAGEGSFTLLNLRDGPLYCNRGDPHVHRTQHLPSTPDSLLTTLEGTPAVQIAEIVPYGII